MDSSVKKTHQKELDLHVFLALFVEKSYILQKVVLNGVVAILDLFKLGNLPPAGF